MPFISIANIVIHAITAFSPPVTNSSSAACEIRVDVPVELSRSKIAGNILQNVPQEYNIEVLDWPTQYATASPPSERWYKAVIDDGKWLLIYRDLDDNEIIEEQVQLTGNAIESDLSGEIATLASAACQKLQNFQRYIATFEAENQRMPAAPHPPPQAPSPGSGPGDGRGFLATSLTLGLSGLVLGVGGFAVAYDRRIAADNLSFDCQKYGPIHPLEIDPEDRCEGDDDTLRFRKQSMVATGVGSVGAAMLGIGLALAIPVAIRRSPGYRAYHADPTISVWGNRTGGGFNFRLRF